MRAYRFNGKYCWLILVAAVQAAAQHTDVRDASQERLKQLEDRVAQLEKIIARLAPDEAAIPTARAELPMPSPAGENPTPPVSKLRPGYQPPPELIPEVGKIGAEVGLLSGGSSNPFQ
jgi:hypothetical protein